MTEIVPTTVDNPLAPFLDRQGVVILDGGLASELEARGHDLSSSLWSAALLQENPQAIVDVHRDFLRAGADVLISASYQASFEGLAHDGVTPGDSEELLRQSVVLARQTVEAEWPLASDVADAGQRLRPLVAASVGPYGAYLADGSEYSGDYAVGETELTSFHQRRLEVLAESSADLLACETIPSMGEARVLTRLLAARRRRGRPTPAWLSFSCRDGRHLADGTELARAVSDLSSEPSWIAIGANCTAPRHMTSLLGELRRASDKPPVIYPNSGEGWDAKAKCWIASKDGHQQDGDCGWIEQAEAWRHQGARILGGCCRTTPEQIRGLRCLLV